MSSSLTLKVASLTSAVTFAKTDQEVGQVLRWFIADKADPLPQGLTQVQQNQFYLDQARDEIVRYVIREARRNRLSELRAEQQDIEVIAAAETEL